MVLKKPIQKLAVVTGANRGIGYEICRQLAQNGILVILTSRDEVKGKAACQKFEKEELPVIFYPLDVTVASSVNRLAIFIKKEYGRCDILVNNAGIFLDAHQSSGDTPPSVFTTDLNTLRQTMETNVYGPLLMCQALIPVMKQNNYGRIINLSSGLGQLSDMNGGFSAYRISKTSLNALTRIFNDELKDCNILVNSMCPGWVKTDMGGPGAMRSVSEGADTAIWLATLPDNGPRGKFFRDRKEIPW